jgi:hypothetical protein
MLNASIDVHAISASFALSSQVLSYATYVLLALSTAAAISAKQRSRGLRHMRKWTTIALALVMMDYLIKCGVEPSGAVVTGLVTWAIVTARSSAIYLLNFTAKDRNNPLQLAISIGSFALCLVATLGSQWYLTGTIDRWTLLPLVGTAFGSLADSLNVEEYRLMIKTAIDAAACITFDTRLTQPVAAAARALVRREPTEAPSRALQTSPT